MTERTCKRCKVTKPISDFARNRQGPYIHKFICRACEYRLRLDEAKKERAKNKPRGPRIHVRAHKPKPLDNTIRRRILKAVTAVEGKAVSVPELTKAVLGKPWHKDWKRVTKAANQLCGEGLVGGTEWHEADQRCVGYYLIRSET